VDTRELFIIPIANKASETVLAAFKELKNTILAILY
jgi:hypothetical protein